MSRDSNGYHAHLFAGVSDRLPRTKKYPPPPLKSYLSRPDRDGTPYSDVWDQRVLIHTIVLG